MARPSIDLADIVPPAAPPQTAWALWVALAIVLAVAIAVYWYFARSPRPAARRRLKRLRRALHQGRLKPRAAAYSLAWQLQRGLRLPHLTASTEPPAQVRGDPATRLRWQRFTAALSRYRYGPTPPAAADALRAIDEARHWLRPWT